MNNDDFMWLQEWYKSKCDGDWEHNKNILIESMDNPGWSISINLFDTELENKSFEVIEIERTPENWIYCFIKEQTFEGRCGPLNLTEVLKTFRNWVDTK